MWPSPCTCSRTHPRTNPPTKDHSATPAARAHTHPHTMLACWCMVVCVLLIPRQRTASRRAPAPQQRRPQHDTPRAPARLRPPAPQQRRAPAPRRPHHDARTTTPAPRRPRHDARATTPAPRRPRHDNPRHDPPRPCQEAAKPVLPEKGFWLVGLLYSTPVPLRWRSTYRTVLGINSSPSTVGQLPGLMN